MREKYSIKKAQEEASKMKAAIQTGGAKNYPEAEILVFWRTKKEFNDPLTEEQLKKRFEYILGNLGLPYNDLHNKKILDVGAGERPIAAYCQLKRISSEVYSVEPNIDYEMYASSRELENWPGIKAQIDRKTVRDKRDALSFEDETFDLVINHATMPGFKNDLQDGNIKKMKTGINQLFNEVIRVLKHGGEARLFPAETINDDEAIMALLKPRNDEVMRKLNQLVKDGICNVKIEEVENEYSRRYPDKPKRHRIIIRKN